MHLITCRHKDQPKLDLWVLVKLAEDVAVFLVGNYFFFGGGGEVEVVLLKPQNTCWLDFAMSLKQIWSSQGALAEERRVFTEDDHLITFVICQSMLAKLDLLSIAARMCVTNIQSGKTDNCISRLQ